MWIFGQVWFACLVGFAVGVALDWVVRVRPLSRRVAELEARLAGDARSARQDGEPGRSVFDRGPFASATLSPDGFVTERNRGGLLTPPKTGGSPDGFATDLIDVGEPTAADRNRSSGVEDFPGVSRISDAWETEAEEATRAAPEPWQPIGPAATAAEESWQQADEPALSAMESTQDNWQTEPNQPSRASQLADSSADESDEADQQYLEFLRAGANHAPTEPEADEIDDGFEEVDFAGTNFSAPEYEPEAAADKNADNTENDADDSADRADDDTDDRTDDRVAAPGSSEVTSVLPLPVIDDGQPQIDGYEAYESYAQDEYQQNGYQEAGYQDAGYQQNGYQEAGYQSNGYADTYSDSGYDAGYQFGEYQPEEVEEPVESSTPLPRRGASGEGSMRFAPFAPYEIPFEEQGAEPADSQRQQQPNYGELTPIEEGGFQPFQKPSGAVEGPYDAAATDGAWIGDDGQLVGLMQDGPQDVSANGSYVRSDADGDVGQSSWFDFGESGAQNVADGALTQRMLPVSRPDLDHPDLLPESVFGTDHDTVYGEDGPARSLFEPVIPPDELEDNFQAPAYEGQQAYADQPAYSEQQSGYQDQQGYADQQGHQDQQGLVDQGYDTPGYGTGDQDPGPSTDEFFSPTTAPRPIRVRTGMNDPADQGPATQSIPAMQPVPAPAQADGDDAGAGPFGPGSALPLPDGSAPSPQFRVKARTSSMVFHTEASPFYERLEPQVWFHDPEVAQRAGFTSWERPRTW